MKKIIDKIKLLKIPRCQRYIEDCSKYCACDEEFNKIIKDLNINIVTIIMKQKDDIKEDFKNQTLPKDRCD
jgi:hypothetical protein